MEPTSRDNMAGLKLLGGLVRLDALQPDGFSAAQLADHARADPETARAFLNPRKGPDYTEVIPGAKAAVGADSRGRPANLYRLRSNRRADLMRRLAEMRRELDAATGAPALPAAQLFAPLDLLEATVEELDRRGDPPDAWLERLAEAQLELGGATADLRALQAKASPDAMPFNLRLAQLKDRLAAVEDAGPPLSFLEKDPIDLLVESFGKWLHRRSTVFEPMLVLLDGNSVHSPMTDALVMDCRAASIHVASFNVANMKADHRACLYAALDRLRVATPLAVSDFVMALDGRTEIALELATEFRDLGHLGMWQERAPVICGDYFAELDLTTLRNSYLAKSRAYLSRPTDDPAPATAARFVERLNSTLAVFATADADKGISHLSFVNPEQHQARLRNAAQALLGDVICLDATHDASIESAFAGVAVDGPAPQGFLGAVRRPWYGPV